MFFSLIGYLLASIAAIFAMFWGLTRLTKWRNRRTAEEVAHIVEKHLNENEGPWDWDEFTSLPIHDDYLDSIRLRCLELDYVPAFDRTPELKRTLEALREGRPGEKS